MPPAFTFYRSACFGMLIIVLLPTLFFIRPFQSLSSATSRFENVSFFNFLSNRIKKYISDNNPYVSFFV